MMDHTTRIGVTSMDNTEMEKEWKELSQRSNDLEDDIAALLFRLNRNDKQLADKKAEFHAVNNKLRRLGIRMNQ